MKTGIKAMRRFAAIAASAAMLLAALPTVSAEVDTFDPEDSVEIETFTSGDYVYSKMVGAEQSGEQAACIEAYSGDQTNVIIPETLDGLSVVALGDRAFAGDYDLESVTLPKSLLAVGLYSFADCTALVEYATPADSAYFETIDGVLYAEDGKYLVRYPIGREPESIIVPDGVTDIGYVAFAYCRTLTSVTLPDTVSNICAWAFADCVSLPGVELPAAVTEIADFTFYRCVAMQSFTIPETITAIGAGAFAATNLETITIPKACTKIGQVAFADTKMKSVEIPATVTDIGFSAFGWKQDSERELYAMSDFVIYGETGSAAALYALDTENGNGFTFVATDKPAATTTTHAALEEIPMGVTTASSDESSDGSFWSELNTVRLVGIIASGLLLLGLIVIAVIGIVRKRNTQSRGKEQDP